MSLVMLGWKKRPFGLDYSFHTCLPWLYAHCGGRERLVDYIGEWLGHLNSILCLSRGDETNGILDINRGKLEWTTSSSFLELRMLFGVYSGYGRHIETSSGCNRVSRLASIKHRENGLVLSRRDGSHDGCGWKQRCMWTILNSDMVLICVCLFVWPNITK